MTPKTTKKVDSPATDRRMSGKAPATLRQARRPAEATLDPRLEELRALAAKLQSAYDRDNEALTGLKMLVETDVTDPAILRAAHALFRRWVIVIAENCGYVDTTIAPVVDLIRKHLEATYRQVFEDGGWKNYADGKFAEPIDPPIAEGPRVDEFMTETERLAAEIQHHGRQALMRLLDLSQAEHRIVIAAYCSELVDCFDQVAEQALHMVDMEIADARKTGSAIPPDVATLQPLLVRFLVAHGYVWDRDEWKSPADQGRPIGPQDQSDSGTAPTPDESTPDLYADVELPAHRLRSQLKTLDKYAGEFDAASDLTNDNLAVIQASITQLSEQADVIMTGIYDAPSAARVAWKGER